MTTSEGRQNLGRLIDGRNPGQDASDGRGGTEPNPGPGPRYVYYRLYAQDGPIKSNNAIYSDNPFIGRIIPRSVPPPRTAASLKRHLCKIEGFSAPENCTLFLSLSENVPVDGGSRLSFQADFGPGLSSSDPVALVVSPQESGKWSPASVWTRASNEVGEQVQTRYIYYRVYDENGEVTSKMSFNKDDTSLGRIETLFVPPPHTVASLKSCISKSEGVSAHGLQVFEDDTGEITMKDDDVIALLADAYPGNVEEQPIAMVYKETLKKFKCKFSQWWTSDDSNWLSLSPGEIFHTDGILTKKCYKTIAINSGGKKGFFSLARGVLTPLLFTGVSNGNDKFLLLSNVYTIDTVYDNLVLF
ncbi:uncharacterized protein LACBIDRAFT_330547 [Laccaria bicolor S238N-H82]|uniref:Predicted protein n=1 Tax=Laccaria bicolor (strain S238N-H82 / ATCC MYA-4686) TaxID=486041 RepID=B0DLN5_LACBS|nr:uncharacterized protein LACBIDRAFT_330547 [Laccaria bicolor S238N-H82]EDR04422.1 predicted protein [Laccaria bicolor S238N-H82]|eukprot:XP_001884941.1 predicted protein [Laccaria bicolor S238N-H82]